jgi:hypothetical protein
VGGRVAPDRELWPDFLGAVLLVLDAEPPGDVLAMPEQPTVNEQTVLEEIRSYPAMIRGVIYVAIFFTILLFIEAAIVLPYTVLRWGWGYTVG